jgi:4-hydroxybenzoyl-CoA thioesterase
VGFFGVRSRLVIAYERTVRFHEVDPAGLLFFPHFMTYAHEAMEQLFAGLPGGYVGLVNGRRIGLPAVAVHADFRAPLGYGDATTVETTVLRLGNRSLTLRYVFVRASDRVLCAELRHTVVSTDLGNMKSCPMPDDVREVAQRHLDAEP